MALKNVSDDQTHRTLAQQLLESAADSIEVEVASVGFGDRKQDEGYAWLCYVVDPTADDLVAPITGSSAADHFALMDPNGFLRETGSRLHLTVLDIELSEEASITVRGADDAPMHYSPWVANLAVVRVTFNYRRADQSA